MWRRSQQDESPGDIRLIRVGGGYWRDLLHAWLRCALGTEHYQDLTSMGNARSTFREWGKAEIGVASEQREQSRLPSMGNCLLSNKSLHS
jgi:hypothetical protein